MAFAVTSNSFKDGDYLPKDFILSADFGFGCAGGNTSAAVVGFNLHFNTLAKAKSWDCSSGEVIRSFLDCRGVLHGPIDREPARQNVSPFDDPDRPGLLSRRARVPREPCR